MCICNKCVHQAAVCTSCNLYDAKVYTQFFLLDISNLKLPPKRKKRGRPKGSELTVIGLPGAAEYVTRSFKMTLPLPVIAALTGFTSAVSG